MIKVSILYPNKPGSRFNMDYYVTQPGTPTSSPSFNSTKSSCPRSRRPPRNRPWITLPAHAGHVVLFESWLRHEVAPNTGRMERVSVSFNYNWF